MIYLSSLLCTKPAYRPATERLTAALSENGIHFCFLEGTKDIWLRDFMPVYGKELDINGLYVPSGRCVSFRYDPSYLREYPDIKTDFKADISGQFHDYVPYFDFVLYSDINLDGGNVILSPTGKRAIISDRVFAENADRPRDELMRELETQLHTHIITIPSDPEDMTGHADGMVRFLDENTVIANAADTPDSLEARIQEILLGEGLSVVDFPYYASPGISAEGCYINYLETEKHIFLPTFGNPMDREAMETAKRLFHKTVVPVRIEEIARDGGCLNCISWELSGNSLLGEELATCPICGTEVSPLYQFCPRCGWEYEEVDCDGDGFSPPNKMDSHLA